MNYVQRLKIKGLRCYFADGVVLEYQGAHPYTLFEIRSSPGWCGSVDLVLACEPKGCQFDSQSRHMPGLQARSPVGGMQEATTH